MGPSQIDINWFSSLFSPETLVPWWVRDMAFWLAQTLISFSKHPRLCCASRTVSWIQVVLNKDEMRRRRRKKEECHLFYLSFQPLVMRSFGLCQVTSHRMTSHDILHRNLIKFYPPSLFIIPSKHLLLFITPLKATSLNRKTQVCLFSFFLTTFLPQMYNSWCKQNCCCFLGSVK